MFMIAGFTETLMSKRSFGTSYATYALCLTHACEKAPCFAHVLAQVRCHAFV